MTAFPNIISNLAEGDKEADGLNREIQELTDLIEFRLPQKGLEETVQGLLPDILELRMRTGQWILRGNNLERCFQAVDEEVQALSKSEHEVDRLLAEALEITIAITQKIMDTVGANKDAALASSSLDLPLNAIEAMEQMPDKSIQFLAKMLKSILLFDGIIVVHSLWKNKGLNLDLEELSRSIRSATSHYGAYSTLIGLWRPDDADERQLIRNIKILAAKLRIKTEPARLYKIEDLEKMAAN